MIHLSAAPMTWVATGDSITQAVLHTHGARGWVEHLQERVRWELDRLTDIVVNTGVSGWRAVDVLGSYEHLIGRFAPDVLSISLGTNDARAGLAGLAEFRDAMRRILERTGPDTQIVLHTPVLVSIAGREARGTLPAYAQAVREVAKETGALLVDHEAYWNAHFDGADPIFVAAARRERVSSPRAGIGSPRRELVREVSRFRRGNASDSGFRSGRSRGAATGRH